MLQFLKTVCVWALDIDVVPEGGGTRPQPTDDAKVSFR